MRTISLIAATTATFLVGPGGRTTLAQQAREAAYIAARDSAIRSLNSALTRGDTANRNFVYDSALASLEDRLRVIIGPVHAKGFSESGRSNLESLYRGDEGFGMLDALVFASSDGASKLWVTTRSLMSHRGDGVPGDLDTLLRNPKFYYNVVSSQAAVYDYGSVALPDAPRLGVVHAMMMILAQDYGRWPPKELLVTVARDRMVYVVTAPLAVTIRPPAQCLAILDSLYALAGVERHGVRWPPTSAADSVSYYRAEREANGADPAFRKCYGERAARDPRFGRIVAQVRSIAAALP